MDISASMCSWMWFVQQLYKWTGLKTLCLSVFLFGWSMLHWPDLRPTTDQNHWCGMVHNWIVKIKPYTCSYDLVFFLKSGLKLFQYSIYLVHWNLNDTYGLVDLAARFLWIIGFPVRTSYSQNITETIDQSRLGHSLAPSPNEPGRSNRQQLINASNVG